MSLEPIEIPLPTPVTVVLEVWIRRAVAAQARAKELETLTCDACGRSLGSKPWCGECVFDRVKELEVIASESQNEARKRLDGLDQISTAICGSKESPVHVLLADIDQMNRVLCRGKELEAETKVLSGALKLATHIASELLAALNVVIGRAVGDRAKPTE